MNPHNIPLRVKYNPKEVMFNTCINCDREFILGEEIISKQANHKRAYYCKECAKRVYII